MGIPPEDINEAQKGTLKHLWSSSEKNTKISTSTYNI